MKILIVYSHPNPASFNYAIKEASEKELEQLGHDVKVRDLYQLGFNPVLSGGDFEGIHSGNTLTEIKEEQDYVDWADALIFIHPVWWTGLPAMVKGYIDRIFSFGFAYTYEDGMPKGLLDGKKVFIINTTGAPFEYYHDNGMHDVLKRTSDEGIYEFCAMEVIDHVFYGAVPAVTDEDRQGYLVDILKKIKKYFA